MAKLLFIGFLTVPLLEIYLFIQVGSIIGAIPTILTILLTAVIGALLLKSQGLATLGRVQSQLNSGHLPATELVEGMMLLVAGALLLTPGFFTDAIGFALLARPVRLFLINKGLLKLIGANFVVSGKVHQQSNTYNRHKPTEKVIEGEVIDRD